MPQRSAISFATCLLCVQAAMAQTAITDPVTTDTVWAADGSPYILRADIEVVQGAVLTIEAGVQVLGDPGMGLYIGGTDDGDPGTLIATGELGQFVTFGSNDRSALWNGVCFRPSAVNAQFSPDGQYLGGSLISFASVSLAEAPIHMDGSVAYLEDVSVRYTGGPANPGIRVALPHDSSARVVARRVTARDCRGAGMYIVGGHSHLLLDCEFVGNDDTGLHIRGSGTIPVDATPTRVERCTSGRNEPPIGEFRLAGGAVLEGLGTVEIIDSIFEFNTSLYEGGGLYLQARDAHISGSRFTLNESMAVGGGAMIRDTSVVLQECRFEENRTGRSGGGLAILDLSGPAVAEVSGCHFQSNLAEIGGALTIETQTEIIEGNTFIDNSSTRDGGAIRIINYARDTRIVDNRFEYNTSLGTGGAISFADTVTSESLAIEGNTFIGNTADLGGAIGGIGGKYGHLDPYDASVTGNTFERNHARLGGALHTSSSGSEDLVLSMSAVGAEPNTFIGNTADLGAAFYNGSTQPVDATGVCWGVALPVAIANRIHDGRDEPGLGIVSFDPVATTCDTCRTDLDGDGALTLFDYLAFTGLFGLGDLQADFDGDGALTIFDFLVYQTEFDAGCG